MRKIMTLVNIEVNRIFKFLTAILGLYAVIQTMYTIVLINNEKTRMLEASKESGLTMEQYIGYSFVNPYYWSSFVKNRAAFMGGAAVCILILIYGLIIWYREWFGNNKVVYTLMMLPVDRTKIYISKFITMLMLIFSMLTAFVIVQFINYMLVVNMLSQYIKMDISFISFIYYNNSLSFIPVNILEFSIYISEILIVVALIFLFVHLEISYKLKGAALGIILGAAYLGILFLLLTSSNILIKEKLLSITLFNVIAVCISGTFSRFLLKNKVRV
ncbi:MAG: hypothetical protein ABRQ25_17745 [Clostridiaceae bacterium]